MPAQQSYTKRSTSPASLNLTETEELLTALKDKERPLPVHDTLLIQEAIEEREEGFILSEN